ncbi:hypothetical protein XU18_4397 [Perkinsela sp. CCAP 1560/4]|nr:hypothetical protein XU18_4397 [Perkinsela sp. CCAP 1560/4]|eukprot:KNH04307.1 hypothetical protein XU18_4397 [Perkinsela sp. CCAP 1560/4]
MASRQPFVDIMGATQMKSPFWVAQEVAHMKPMSLCCRFIWGSRSFHPFAIPVHLDHMPRSLDPCFISVHRHDMPVHTCDGWTYPRAVRALLWCRPITRWRRRCASWWS